MESSQLTLYIFVILSQFLCKTEGQTPPPTAPKTSTAAPSPPPPTTNTTTTSTPKPPNTTITVTPATTTPSPSSKTNISNTTVPPTQTPTAPPTSPPVVCTTPPPAPPPNPNNVNITTNNTTPQGGCTTPPPTPAPVINATKLDLIFGSGSFSEELAAAGVYSAHIAKLLGIPQDNVVVQVASTVPFRYGNVQGLQTAMLVLIRSTLNVTQISDKIQAALADKESDLSVDGVRSVVTEPAGGVRENLSLTTATVSAGWYALIVLAVIVTGLLAYVFSRNRAATSEHKDVEHAYGDSEEHLEDEDAKLHEQLLDIRKDEDSERELEKLLQKVEMMQTQPSQTVDPAPSSGRGKESESTRPKELRTWLKQDGDFQLPPRVKAKIASNKAHAYNDALLSASAQDTHVPRDGGKEYLDSIINQKTEFQLPPKRAAKSPAAVMKQSDSTAQSTPNVSPQRGTFCPVGLPDIVHDNSMSMSEL